LSGDNNYLIFSIRDTADSKTWGNQETKIYRKNLLNEEIIRIDGTNRGGYSSNPRTNNNGTKTLFTSNLKLTTDNINANAMYLAGLDGANTILINKKKDGTIFLSDYGWHADLSADGNIVVFQTGEAIENSDTNGISDVYMKNITTSAITRISLNSNGGIYPFISPNAKYIAYQVYNNSNRYLKLYETTSGTTADLPEISPKNQGNFNSESIISLGDNGGVFWSCKDYAATDSNNDADYYFYGLSTPTPNYEISTSAPSTNEGSKLKITVATTNVASGTKIYFSLSGTGITESDFSSGNLNGSDTVGSDGSFSFSRTLANDQITEGNEWIEIKLFSDKNLTTQVGSTISTLIADTSVTPPPTYTLTPSESSINEGSALTTTINTTNVASGTALYYSLSGTGITSADFSSGALTGSGSVASNGSFSFSHTLANDLVTEGNETLNIKLYSDSSRSTQVGSTASVAIADTSITPAPTAAVFSVTGTTVTEGDVAGVVVSRSGNTTFAVTLNVTTSNGTAIAGSDYNAINQNLIFNIGETTKTVTIPTINDSDVESDETFFANISSTTANTSIATSSAGITIGNDDFRTNTTFSLADLTIEEGKTRTATITRSGDTSFTHVVALSTQNDTATSGTDYNSYSNSVTFTPGQSSITVSLATIDDVDYEGNEAFYLVGGTISGGSNNSATWVSNRAKVNILDNDLEIKPLIEAGAYATLSVAPGTLPQYLMSGTNLDLYYLYVEQYPLTLRTAFYNEYLAGRFTNEALYGQNHWVNYGQAEGRSLPDPTATTLVDSNDYGAYVENYGSTLLDIYRKDARAVMNGGAMSLFAWGKEHYTNWGKAEGREISGGVDWGSIVRNNLNLYNQWQDARLVTPTLSAFAYGFRNQSGITSTLNVKIGSDTQDKITGSIVYGLNANDVLVGTSGGDILSGGFGDDLIVGVNGGSDIVYGGPGRDVFQLNSGTTLNIRDFRKGADLIQLGDSLTSSGVTMQWDSADNSTYFYQGASILAKVFGRRPTEFSYADSSSGISKVYI
jgi:Calx-beta domain/RTX calcium-binding nonapeptide repeat (4 copies)